MCEIDKNWRPPTICRLISNSPLLNEYKLPLSIVTNCFPVSVSGSNEPPVIVAPPMDTSTSLANALNLTCGATGNPPPTYRWYRDGELLPGEVLPYFYIGETTPEDRGYYHCEVMNSIDRDQSMPALVTIPGKHHCPAPSQHL